MKKITLIITLFLTALGYSQSLPIEFNDSEAFVGQGGVTYSEATDPTFNLNKVGKMEGGGAQYSSLIGLQLDTYIDMTTSAKTFTFQFYTTEAVPMNGLFQLNGDQDGGNPIEMRFTTDGNIGWETITLDFNDAKYGFPNGDVPIVYGQYATVNIFSNFADTGSSTYYIDSIRGAANGAAVGSDSGTDPDPGTDLTAAPTPNKAPADVISVYSDAYTSIATEIDPFWGQATDATEIQLDGNNTLKYANLNYQGLEYPVTNVSAMEFLHLDYYTDDATFDFSLISTGPLENAYTIPVVTGSWQSVDIPLSAYTVPELDKVFQFKTEGNGTVYLDNLYFWKAPAAAGTDSSLSALTVDGSSIADFGALKKNYSVELPAETTVVPAVVATPTDTNASAVVTAATSIPGTTTIDVTAQDGITTTTFSIAFTLEATNSAAAPTPSQDSADVISVYSDAYTDNIATNLNPNWNQATNATEIQIDGNNTLEYANLNYQGLDYSTTDVSAMEYVHLDYKTDDATALDFYLISTNPTVENAYTISIVKGDWQSIDIPLSVYNANLDRVFQFKTVGNGTVYFDNIYFWKAPAAAGTDTTLSALTVDGSSIANFGALSSSYSVELPAGTTVVPTVAATTTDTNASAVVTAATSIPGTTTIAVTAQDGVTTNTVSIAWTIDPKPTTAAPTPTWESDDVISVYSDAYTSIANNTNPGWGQATQTTEVQIDGNNTLEYANLNYQGMEYPETDVSAMRYLHLDYYTNDATALEFFLITNGGESTENAYDIAASVSFALGQWVSLDIPLTFYSDSGQDLAKAFQFKTEGNGTVYLDNMYFYDSDYASVGDVQKEAAQVAPNPTSGLINKTGDIYNVTGQIVLTNSNDLSGLPSGIYFIKVIANGNVSTSKIIKK